MKKKDKVAEQSKQDQRKAERVLVSHQISVGKITGVVSDISVSGVYFVVDATFSLGEIIFFVIELGRQNVNFILRCIGEVVRVENRHGKVGVGVKISESVMESA